MVLFVSLHQEEWTPPMSVLKTLTLILLKKKKSLNALILCLIYAVVLCNHYNHVSYVIFQRVNNSSFNTILSTSSFGPVSRRHFYFYTMRRWDPYSAYDTRQSLLRPIVLHLTITCINKNPSCVKLKNLNTNGSRGIPTKTITDIAC